MPVFLVQNYYPPVTAGYRFAELYSTESSQALATLVLEEFQKGTESEFAAVYPFRDGRDAVAIAIRGEFDRVAGLQRVIREQGDRAIMVLSGVPRVGNSGDETILGRGFSGVYEAGKQGRDWKLLRRIPLEELGEIRAHKLLVNVRPAYGLEVEDGLQYRAKRQWGFVARLNHAARIETVAWRGDKLHYAFDRGLFWAEVPEGQGRVAPAIFSRGRTGTEQFQFGLLSAESRSCPESILLASLLRFRQRCRPGTIRGEGTNSQRIPPLD
jgi:hypothetical protein